MERLPEPRIKSAERLENSVIITFDDGKFGVFSAHLLREALSEFELLDEAAFMVEEPSFLTFRFTVSVSPRRSSVPAPRDAMSTPAIRQAPDAEAARDAISVPEIKHAAHAEAVRDAISAAGFKRAIHAEAARIVQAEMLDGQTALFTLSNGSIVAVDAATLRNFILSVA